VTTWGLYNLLLATKRKRSGGVAEAEPKQQKSKITLTFVEIFCGAKNTISLILK
jgi:hypothetical protein